MATPPRLTAALALLGALTVSAACRRPPEPSGESSGAASSTTAPPRFELELSRAALVAFGATTPLPLDADFSTPVPQLAQPLQKVARNRPGEPGRLRVARDVPYGQVWRVVSAGASAGIGAWEIATPLAGGGEATLHLGAGFGLGAVECFVTAWVGPDASVSVGLEGRGILVRARERQPSLEPFLGVVRRLDAKCAQGELRLNSQMTAAWGPLFDVGRAVESSPSPPKVRTLRLAVGHVGPADPRQELVGP